MSTKVEHPAKVGDWIVVESVRTTHYVGAPTQRVTQWELAQVTRARRDGTAVAWVDGNGVAMRQTGKVMVIDAAKVPGDVVRQVATAHTYGEHSVTCAPWDSLGQLRADLKAALRQTAGA